MSTSRSTHGADRADTGTTLPELDLWNWPLVQGGWRSWLVVLATVIAAVTAGQLTRSPPMGLLTCGVLMLAMWRFWLPVRYQIRSQGIIESYFGRRRLITWHSVQRCRLRKQGVVILFDPNQLWFDAFSATYIEGGDQQEQLVEVIRFYRQSDHATGDDGS